MTLVNSHGRESVAAAAAPPLRSREQIDGGYWYGALFADAVTPAVHALHRCFHLAEIGPGGRQLPCEFALLDTRDGQSFCPRPVVRDGENLHLPPPEILQLFP